MSFKELVHFVQIIKFVGKEMFRVFLYILLMFMGFRMMLTLSFMVLVICVLFLSWLTWLDYQFYCIFKETAFVFIDCLLISCFNFFNFCFDFHYLLSSASFGFNLLFFLQYPKWKVRLWILYLSSFLIYASNVTNFPLIIAFTTSHKFG